MMDETRLRHKYPEFVMATIDGMSPDAIAESLGLDTPTVCRRIEGQKRSFLARQCKRAGLTVEGDESMSDLEEAYKHSLIRRD